MPNDGPKSKNRSSLLFLFGLAIAAFASISFDGWGHAMLLRGQGAIDQEARSNLAPVGPRTVSAQDKEAAKTAWQYLAQNTRPETGFVDAVAGFPSATLWDQGSYLMGLNAAFALGIVGESEYGKRVSKFFESLERLELFNGQLPNKAYNTQTLEMVGYDNTVSKSGIGWSALDIGRLLFGLRLIERRSPEYGKRIRKILARWELRAMAYNGELTGALLEGGELTYPQEGRIGYEQYAARMAALWGLDVVRAMSIERNLRWESAPSGVRVPVDLRSSAVFGAINPTLSEPYFLQGLEIGFDTETQKLAAQIYLAQEERFANTGIATMVSEDHINQKPYFLYSSVFSNDEVWAVVTENGESHNDKRTVSLKAVFGWDALYHSDYTQQLREQYAYLATSKGWMTGVYEKGGEVNDVMTLNTNAVVLEAIHYIAFGPLWQLN